MDEAGRYRRFADFYPFYLTEHANPVSRRLHVVGTGLVVLLFAAAVLTLNVLPLLAAPVVGYGFAWVGHLAFERNRPATFRYPLFSLMGDFRLFFETVSGRRPW